MKQYKRVLTIAGSDSCGGAGVQADIKTISACGCYAMSAITAITAQNTAEVRAIHNVPADMVAAQIAAVLEDVGADAVKLGMLPTAECVKAIAELLLQFNVPNVVLDPVERIAVWRSTHIPHAPSKIPSPAIVAIIGTPIFDKVCAT